MLDAGNAIEIDLSSSEYNIFENGRSNFRYILGYISGEFLEIETDENLFVTVYFKRNIDLVWESVTFQLNAGEKIFYQKLPAGLLVTHFYVRLYGWITDGFELSSFKVSIKEIPIGKFAGESLVLLDEEQQPEPPSFRDDFVPFEIKIPQVGNVAANTATVVWATTHRATGRVVYGLTAETMINEVSSSEFEIYHSLILTNLQLEERYYCQIYSVSELTGGEIHSDVIQFFTGKEVTIQSIFGDIDAQFLLKQKQELFIESILNETEILTTLEPDGDGDVSTDAQFITYTKVEILVENTIGTDYDYSVTP